MASWYSDRQGDHARIVSTARFSQPRDAGQPDIAADESCRDESVPKRLFLFEGAALVQAVEMSSTSVTPRCSMRNSAWAVNERSQFHHYQRQRFQQLFFPDGIAFDGNRFIGTRATALAFSYLREIRTEKEGLVDQTGIEPVTS